MAATRKRNRKRRYTIRKLVISSLHALIITVLTFVWMNQNWQLGDEVLVARINQVMNILVLGKKQAEVERLKDKFLLINCSYDKKIAPYEDLHGTGVIPVTDRQKLARLLPLLRASQPKCIAIDLTFDIPTPDDSALISEMRITPGLIAADYESNSVKAHEGIHTALAEYSTTSGIFLKAKIMNGDSSFYLPAAIYEYIHPTPIHERLGFVHAGNEWWMNAFIVDLRLRKVHLENNTLVCWNLGDALSYFTPEQISAIARDRIVIIGDFYLNDQHDTLLGKQPGPLLVANTYAALTLGDARISWFAVIVIFLLYFLSTLYVLSLKDKKRRLFGKKMGQNKILSFVLKYLTYIVTFTFFSLLLYMITGKHHQLLLFAFYFNLLEFWSLKYKWRKKLE